MANVIRLSRFRGVSHRDLRLGIPAGDSDLRPVAVMLWLASVILTVLTLVHHEAFGVEATLAFVCAVFLPAFILRLRHVRDTARQ
jgi:hypothetical protein